MSRTDTDRPRTVGLTRLQQTLRIGLFSLSIWTFAQHSASAQTTQTIPFKIERNFEMTVNLSINDRKTKGTIDSAATIAIIDDKFISKAARRQSKRLQVNGATGQRGFKQVNVQKISLGEHNLTDVRAALNDRNSFPGSHNVIPLNALQGRVVDFDFYNQEALLYTEAPQSIPNHMRVEFEYTLRKGLIFIPVHINGVAGQAFIDTGANRSFVNPEFVKQAHIATKRDRARQVTGASGRSKYAQVARLKNLEFGSLQHPKTEIDMAALNIFSHLGVADQPAMLLGLDILHKYRVQIDRSAQRVSLLRPMPQRSQARPYTSALSPES